MQTAMMMLGVQNISKANPILSMKTLLINFILLEAVRVMTLEIMYRIKPIMYIAAIMMIMMLLEYPKFLE